MTYYSFERPDGSGYDGLIRFNRKVAEYAKAGFWIEDHDVAGRIRDPGADGPQVISEELAADLALCYGVEL